MLECGYSSGCLLNCHGAKYLVDRWRVELGPVAVLAHVSAGHVATAVVHVGLRSCLCWAEPCCWHTKRHFIKCLPVRRDEETREAQVRVLV